MKGKALYLYYTVLILALVLYTNTNQSPSMLIRMGYLAALVVPLFDKVELFPVIIICSLGIAMNTFAYPLMPTGIVYYVVLGFLFAFLSLSRRGFRTRIKPLFLFAFVYLVVNDLSLHGGISHMAIMFLLFILFFFCIEEEETALQLFPSSFIAISLAISYWVIFCPEALTNTYNMVDDLEQKSWTDPNYLSAVLGMGFVVTIRDLFKGENKLQYKVLLIVVALSSTIGLLILASRGAIVSVIIAASILLISSKTNKYIKVGAILFALAFIVFLYSNQYMDLIAARIESDDGSGSYRTEIWLSKLNEFFLIINPFSLITGVGQTRGGQLGTYMGSSAEYISTHNDYLSMLIYYGVAGFIVFLYIIAYPLKICQKTVRPQIASCLAYLLMCSMTIEPLAQGNFVYWGFLFYIIIWARESQRRNHKAGSYGHC